MKDEQTALLVIKLNTFYPKVSLEPQALEEWYKTCSDLHPMVAEEAVQQIIKNKEDKRIPMGHSPLAVFLEYYDDIEQRYVLLKRASAPASAPKLKERNPRTLAEWKEETKKGRSFMLFMKLQKLPSELLYKDETIREKALKYTDLRSLATFLIDIADEQNIEPIEIFSEDIQNFMKETFSRSWEMNKIYGIEQTTDYGTKR